ncbi:MAG: S8 family serine peptidase [Legionellaceae bacterium]|nr:S8 family serine peptidase [Legionellaceae bacterium]
MHVNFSNYIFIGLLCISYSLQTNPQHTSEDSCLLLGPTPSFIIKPSPQFMKYAQAHGLTAQYLNQNLRKTDIYFTDTSAIANGYFIAHFTPIPKNMHNMGMPHQHCYSSTDLQKINTLIKKNMPNIEEVTPNFLSSITSYAKPDPNIQWNLLEAPGGIDISQYWAYFTHYLPSIIVAVLDTGIMTNQALNQNILPGVYFSNAGDYGLSAAPSCVTCAGANHGTLVAGIIAATGKLAYGQHVFGVAPQSNILPVNVFTRFDDKETCGYPPCMYSYLSDQINALHWLMGKDFFKLPAAPKTIKAINMSLGNLSDCPVFAQKTLTQAKEKGQSVVVASGNQDINASRVYPANCTDVISVAATGKYGERADYSNWGEAITIAAPGGNKQHSIYSTTHDSYRYLQGTSLAAPHVTGVIALIYAINPNLTASEATDMITSKDTTTPFPESNALPQPLRSCNDIHLPQKTCGIGILNAYKATAKAKLTLEKS